MQEQDTRPKYIADLMDLAGIQPRSIEGMSHTAMDAFARSMGVSPEDLERAARRWGLW